MKWTPILRCLYCQEYKHLRIPEPDPEIPVYPRFCTQRCAAAYGVQQSTGLAYCKVHHEWYEEDDDYSHDECAE